MKCWLHLWRGEGGAAADAYALRWCLFHMKRSCSEGEAVARRLQSVVCAEAERSATLFPSWRTRTFFTVRTLLLSDSLVLSRNLLSRAPLLEQLWQRLTPRADAESSPPRCAWPTTQNESRASFRSRPCDRWV